ncbi:MAG: N-acyl homoserine lactonase family protein [Pseudomonadota bacterium]
MTHRRTAHRRLEGKSRPFFVRITALASLTLACAFASAPGEDASVELWRLDCGTMDIDDLSYFSDTYLYDGQSGLISNGCYLIRHGGAYLLWDAGIPSSLLDNTKSNGGWVSSISITLKDQLEQIGLAPDDITYLGISHFHGDHIGQAADFANSTLLMSSADANAIRIAPTGSARRRLAAWFDGESAMQEFSVDHDVFGDGSVTILMTPGHTPGHVSLLVRLKETGPVLLSGDLYHFRSEIGQNNVSRWNVSRADTLASAHRFERIIEALDPVVVVQHDPADIDRLPAFPKSAK